MSRTIQLAAAAFIAVAMAVPVAMADGTITANGKIDEEVAEFVTSLTGIAT